MLKYTGRAGSTPGAQGGSTPFLTSIIKIGIINDISSPASDRPFCSQRLQPIHFAFSISCQDLLYFRSLSVILAHSACAAPHLALLRKCSPTLMQMIEIFVHAEVAVGDESGYMIRLAGCH